MLYGFPEPVSNRNVLIAKEKSLHLQYNHYMSIFISSLKISLPLKHRERERGRKMYNPELAMYCWGQRCVLYVKAFSNQSFGNWIPDKFIKLALLDKISSLLHRTYFHTVHPPTHWVCRKISMKHQVPGIWPHSLCSQHQRGHVEELHCVTGL